MTQCVQYLCFLAHSEFYFIQHWQLPGFWVKNVTCKQYKVQLNIPACKHDSDGTLLGLLTFFSEARCFHIWQYHGKQKLLLIKTTWEPGDKQKGYGRMGFPHCLSGLDYLRYITSWRRTAGEAQQKEWSAGNPTACADTAAMRACGQTAPTVGAAQEESPCLQRHSLCMVIRKKLSGV